MNGGVSNGLLPALLDPPLCSCLNSTTCCLPFRPDKLYFSTRGCGRRLPIAGSVSRILAATMGRKRDSPPRRVEMRVRRELRYSWGPGSKVRDSRGTQDITSMRVQATSKTFSICEVGVSGFYIGVGEERPFWREGGTDEADAMDFHGLFRELACHFNEVFGNLDWESERH